MTPYKLLAVVACRVLGVYLIVKWLSFSLFCITPAFWGGTAFKDFAPLFMAILTLLVPIFLGALLWALAPWIARRMLANMDDGRELPSGLVLSEVQAIAISVLGLAFVVYAIPDVVARIWDYCRFLEMEPPDTINIQWVSGFVAKGVQIGLGIWLFFGARNLVKLFQRFNASRE